MQKGSTVTLNDVTIAGCRNQSTVGTEGTGGGVRIEGGDATLNMYDSTITGCFANNGGGIHVDAAGKATINLDDSHVDGNYAKRDGGGIYLFGKGVSITGSEDSTVSRNFCTLHGGGIHVLNSKVTIQGIAVKGNGATDGGGICTRNDAIALRKLDIEGNTASTAGGGVCIVSDAATNMLKHLAAMDANGGRWKPPMMPKATPTPTPNPTTPASGTTKPTTSAKATPKSGDSLLHLGLLAVTLAAAAGATLIVTRRVRKGR